MSTALVWFRRDLRLTDHPALRAALDQHEHVVPLYLHAPDEEGAWMPGAASRWWLHHSLAALGEALQRCGAPLVIRHGSSLKELLAVAKAVDAEAVYWNRLYEPAVIARDKQIKTALREHGIDAHSFNAALLFEPWDLETGGGAPYRVFTPFWRNAEAKLRQQFEGGRKPLAAVKHIAAPTKIAKSVSLDSLKLLPAIDWDAGFREAWQPGEAGAKKRLDTFLEHRLAHYRERRDFPATDASSQLSPHLHFGEVSPLQIAARVDPSLAEAHHGPRVRANGDAFVRQVAWREFAHHLLFHFPETPDEPMYDKFANFPWRAKKDYASDLRAWQRGETGIPIVDAGMRQLWHTGWMHNRVRLIVASLLTKNLLIPWQEGETWFWDTLVDADLANNTLGWQWVAGCGADAAPYFRIFNPVSQSAKFDADGAYVKTWVPELAKLPVDAIHSPSEAAPEALAAAKLTLGKDYPVPIVDLKASRERALAAYAAIKAA